VGPVADTPTVLPLAATPVAPSALTPVALPEAATPVSPDALTPVPVPPDATMPIPLTLVAYIPQPEPWWDPHTPMPRPPVPLFWPRTADEKLPGLELVITPLMAVASEAV